MKTNNMHWDGSRWMENDTEVSYQHARRRWDAVNAHWTMAGYNEMTRIVMSEPNNGKDEAPWSPPWNNRKE